MNKLNKVLLLTLTTFIAFCIAVSPAYVPEMLAGSLLLGPISLYLAVIFCYLVYHLFFLQEYKKNIKILFFIVFSSLALILPILPLKLMPIWTLRQWDNFQFIYENICFFGFMGLVTMTYYKDIDWQWQKYFKFWPLVIILLISIILFLSAFGVSYTSIGFVFALIPVIAVQAGVEELLFRGLWLQDKKDQIKGKFKQIFAVFANGAVFGFFHKPVFQYVVLAALLVTSLFGLDVLDFYTIAVTACCCFFIFFHPLPLATVAHFIIHQGSFGVAMAIVSFITGGVELGCFYHALHNISVFLLEGYPAAAFMMFGITLPTIPIMWWMLVESLILVIITYLFWPASPHEKNTCCGWYKGLTNPVQSLFLWKEIDIDVVNFWYGSSNDLQPSSHSIHTV